MTDTTTQDVLHAIHFEWLRGEKRFAPTVQSGDEAYGFILKAVDGFRAAVWDGKTDYACACKAVQLAATCVRAIIDLGLLSGMRCTCPRVEQVVPTQWCEARGQKSKIGTIYAECENQWRPIVRAACCRAYFDEVAKEETANGD